MGSLGIILYRTTIFSPAIALPYLQYGMLQVFIGRGFKSQSPPANWAHAVNKDYLFCLFVRAVCNARCGFSCILVSQEEIESVMLLDIHSGFRVESVVLLDIHSGLSGTEWNMLCRWIYILVFRGEI